MSALSMIINYYLYHLYPTNFIKYSRIYLILYNMRCSIEGQ